MLNGDDRKRGPCRGDITTMANPTVVARLKDDYEAKEG
jgi:hypothetical protein